MCRYSLVLLLSLGTVAPLAAQTFLNKTVDKWSRDLSDTDPAVRRAAAYALGKLGAESIDAVKPLSERLRDDSASVREGAAWGLGDIAAAESGRAAGRVWLEAGSTLQKLLGDKEPRVRRAAAYALGRCRGLANEAAPELRKLLTDDEQPMVRQNAAHALGQMRDDKPDAKTVKALAGASKKTDEDPYVLREIVNALAAQIGDNAEEAGEATDDATIALFALVKREPERLVLKPTIRALQTVATRKHAEQALLVEKYLEDKDPDVRKPAAFVLANVAGPKGAKAVKVLLDVLLLGDEKEQYAAAGAFAGLGEGAAAAVGDLARVLEDDQRPLETRVLVVYALSRIRKNIDSIIPSLVKALDAKQEARIRECAAEALAALNFSETFKNKDMASDALVRLFKEDSAPRVRQRALWALYTVPNLRSYGLLEPMLAVVKDKDSDRVLRYDTARVLAHKQREETSDEVIDCLVDMLSNDKITVYVPSDTKSTSGGSESPEGGGTSRMVQNKGGDARFMAAQALALVGPRVKQRQPSAVDKLKKLKESKDQRVVEAADLALKSIGG